MKQTFKVTKKYYLEELKKLSHISHSSTIAMIGRFMPDTIELQGEPVEEKNLYPPSIMEVAMGSKKIPKHIEECKMCYEASQMGGGCHCGLCECCKKAITSPPKQIEDSGGHTCTNGNCDCLSKQNPPLPIEEIDLKQFEEYISPRIIRGEDTNAKVLAKKINQLIKEHNNQTFFNMQNIKNNPSLTMDSVQELIKTPHLTVMVNPLGYKNGNEIFNYLANEERKKYPELTIEECDNKGLFRFDIIVSDKFKGTEWQLLTREKIYYSKGDNTV